MPGKNKDYSKKLFRLVRILNRLETEGKVSPRELAEDFNVNVRTAQRDIDLINMAKFPLVSMEKGSWSFMQGFSLKRLPISSEEASLLAFLCEVAQSMGGVFAKSFESLLSKATMSGGGPSPFHAIATVTSQLDLPALAEVKAAIEDRREISAVHANGNTYRLRPLKIIYSEGFWYLIATLKGKAHYRPFRLDRIKSVEALGATFEPPKNLEKTLAQSINIWSGQRKDIRVVLRVDADVAEYFELAVYFPGQKKVKTLRDGSLILEATASHLMEVIPVIQRWIPYIHVVRPRALRDRIKASVREYLKGRS